MVNPRSGASEGLTYVFLKILPSAACAKMFAPKWALICIGQSSCKNTLLLAKKAVLNAVLHGVAAEHATFNNIPPVYYLLLLYNFLYTDIFCISFYNYE